MVYASQFDLPADPKTDITVAAPTSRNNLLVTALFALVLVWTFVRFWSHPEAIFDSRFLVHDFANQLHLNDELLEGKRLYSEVFSQYGPASAYLSAVVALLFGNTARSFMFLQSLLAIVALGQVYVLLQRHLQPWKAVVFTAFAVLPWIPSPAGGPGAYLQPYGGFERIILLSIALAWRPLTERTIWRNVCLGLLLGSLQWIKFGSAFIAGGALFFADLILLVHRGELRRAGWKNITAANCGVLAGFLIGECALWIYAALTQPAVIARDVLWPAYMINNYAGYVTWNTRFLDWENVGYFIVAQLPLVAAIVSFAFLLGRLLGRRSRNDAATTEPVNLSDCGAFVFLSLFWVVGLSGYLAHVWLAMGYAWLLMVGAAPMVGRLRPVLILIAFAAWAPSFLLTARDIAPSRTATDLKPVPFQNGEILWLDGAWQERLPILSRFLAQQCGAPPHSTKAVMGIVTGAGIAHYLGYSVSTRHSWFMPGFVRPYDEDAVRASLLQTGALIVFLKAPVPEPLPPNANRWTMGRIFSDALAAEIPQHFRDPVRLDATCWVLPTHDLSSQR